MKLRRMIWLFLWVISLIGISFYGGAVSYGFFAAITFIPVVSWIYLFAVFLRFKVYQELEGRNAVCSLPVPYFFVLKNEDFFAFASVSVRMFSDFSKVLGIVENTEYELLPGKEFRLETSLVCRYRGEYDVGIREIIVTDFFRLFSLKYSWPGRIRALVLPKIVKLPQLKSIGDLRIDLQKETLLKKQMPDIPVRGYIQGDPLKQIHHKASARLGKLMVRELAGEEKEGVAVFVATRRYGDMAEYIPLENKMLEIVLALLYFMAEKNISSRLLFGQNGLQVCHVNGLHEFNSVYRKTADITFFENEVPEMTAGSAYTEFAKSSIVFFVVHEMNQNYLTLAYDLRRVGTESFFYVVTDEGIREYAQMKELSGRIFQIEPEDDLEDVL